LEWFEKDFQSLLILDRKGKDLD